MKFLSHSGGRKFLEKDNSRYGNIPSVTLLPCSIDISDRFLREIDQNLKEKLRFPAGSSESTGENYRPG